MRNAHHVLHGLARTRDIFAYVDHVDECGAPILAAGVELGICENDMPGTTPVRVYGTGGYLTTVPLAAASRDAERGILARIGAHEFRLTAAAERVRGPGLTPTQARRRYLAKQAR